MLRKIVLVVVLAAILGGVLGLVTRYFFHTSTPWEASGRLVMAVRSVPGPTSDQALGLGIDDILLQRIGDDSLRASVLTRRVLFDTQQDKLHVLLDTTVPVGTYSGFTFTLTSPELRNAWEEDAPPSSVSLLTEHVTLPSPYTVQEDETTVILLGFETMQAIHEQTSGSMYLPVLQVETRSGAVVTTAEGVAHVNGGDITTNATYGMDWNGTMRRNYREKYPQPER